MGFCTVVGGGDTLCESSQLAVFTAQGRAKSLNNSVLGFLNAETAPES